MNIARVVLALLLLVYLGSVETDTMAHGQTIVDPSLFQQPKQTPYLLESGDTIGVFVEGVTGESNSMPPVHHPPVGSDLPPAMGFPTLVLHDGTIRLPVIDRIDVRGLSVPQVESLIRKKYLEGQNPIITAQSRVIVSLMRKRTVNVLVVRGDQSQSMMDARFRGRNTSSPVSARSDRSGRIYNLQLPAGDNDLLNAMIQSGGIPGVNSQDQLKVLRNQTRKKHQSDFVRSRVGSDQSRFSQTFPLRSHQGFDSRPPFPRSQTRLNSGDIVSIEAKPTEAFYTGGLLGGGEFLIPRDRAISITEAISMVGGIPQSRGVGVVPLELPQSLTLLRRNGNTQVSRRFNLVNGFSQQASRTRVMPGDYLILDYSDAQRVRNIGVGVLNAYGVRQLFQN